jgi:hypothetical protein
VPQIARRPPVSGVTAAPDHATIRSVVPTRGQAQGRLVFGLAFIVGFGAAMHLLSLGATTTAPPTQVTMPLCLLAGVGLGVGWPTLRRSRSHESDRPDPTPWIWAGVGLAGLAIAVNPPPKIVYWVSAGLTAYGAAVLTSGVVFIRRYGREGISG